MNYRKSSPAVIKEWFAFKNSSKGLSLAVSSFVAGYNAAEQRLHLTDGILRDLLANPTPNQLSALKDLLNPPIGR